MLDISYHLRVDHFKIGHYGDKHVKNINLAIFVSGIVIVVTLIFYILMYTFTNYRALDDLEDMSEAYSKGRDMHFSEINIAAKIKPSYNLKDNAIWMFKTREVSLNLINMY